MKHGVIIAAACLCVSAAAAERICIQVTDPSGASAPGVTLALGEWNARTGAAGNHCFSGLPPGKYKLTTAHPDFDPTEQLVDTADTSEVRLSLRLKNVQTQLTVTADEASTPEPADRLVLDSEAIGRLPVLGRDAIAAASEWLDPGSAASGAATVIVDGMEVPATSVNPSLIEQITISQNPYSSEFARPGRGRIEIVTKAGTKDFHGSFVTLFRHSALDARHAFAVQKPDERRRTLEASLTGPIGRSGRDFFVLSFARENEAVQSLVLARTLDGEVRANVPTPAADSEWSAGWNRHFQNASALSLRYEFDAETEKNRGTGGFRLPGAGFDTIQSEHQLRGGWRGLLGGAFVETNIQLERAKDLAISSASISPLIVVEDAFTSGSAQADREDKETSLRLNQIFSWSHGSHVIRAGYQVPNAGRYRVLDRRDTLGTFRFSSLENFAAGKPYSWSAQSLSPAIAFWRIQQSAFIQDDWQVRPNLKIGLGLRWAWQNALSSRLDVAPRLSLARAFGSKRSTVLRAGIGVFHDTIDSDIIARSILFDGSRSRRLLILNPAYPEPFSGDFEQRQVPVNLYRFAASLRSPFLMQASLGLDRKWGRNVSSSISYVASRGGSLFRSRDRNAPFEAGLSRPDSNWGVVQEIESEGRMSGNALDLNLRGSLPRKITLAAQYRLAAYKNDTGGTNWFPAYPYAPWLDWGRADSDIRHSVTLMADWQIWRAIAVGCIFRANSGSPYTVTTGSDDNGDGLARDRPPGIGRNTREGFGWASLDLRVSREVQLKQFKETRLRGRFSFDAFNLSNSTNFTSFVGTIRSPYFGQPTSARPPRRLQASFQLRF